MTMTNPSISGEVTRSALQGEEPAAKASAAALSRAERDAQELADLEHQLYYPAADPAPASAPSRGLIDRLRVIIRR